MHRKPKAPSLPADSSKSVERRKSTLPRLDQDEEGTGSKSTQTNLSVPTTIPPPTFDTLTVLNGVDEGKVFPVVEEVTLLGRQPECEVNLTDRGVSRHHASLVRSEQGLHIRDHDAKNGTFINGRRVQEEDLRPGDEIQLGAVVRLLYTHAGSLEARVAQQRAARERLLQERIYVERLEGIANMVASVAHKINTPLGVAITANGTILSLIEEVGRTPPGPELDELIVDVLQSARLVNRSLERAGQLIRSFRELSASQLSDERVTCELAGIVRDSLEALSSEIKQRRVVFRTTWTEGAHFNWVGFPGHLSQVLRTLIQNVLHHAYKDEAAEGAADLRLAEQGDFYRMELEDFGAGVPSDLLPRIFEPFVTSDRSSGGAGLGLAISHNIVTNLLKGTISCTSREGKGTKVTLRIPRVVPTADAAKPTTS